MLYVVTIQCFAIFNSKARVCLLQSVKEQRLVALINCNIQKSCSNDFEVVIHPSIKIRESVQIDASILLQPRFTSLYGVLSVAPNECVNIIAKIIYTRNPVWLKNRTMQNLAIADATGSLRFSAWEESARWVQTELLYQFLEVTVKLKMTKHFSWFMLQLL